jgi:6-hydroxycyclohex-1-ene-1-carbonyl-CoA dehydrogenase
MAALLATSGVRWEMRAGGEPLVRTEFELAPPGPGQAWVRVAGCGVCHTDLGFLYGGVQPRAGLPLTLGHEISGVVVAAAPGWEHLVERAVIVPAVTPCGECAACEAGHGTICARQVMPGNDLPGGFASHVLVPARGLCRVDVEGALEGLRIASSGCTLSELAVVADALTTPYQALRRAGVGPSDLAVVIGLGGVGGFAVQIARARGAVVAGFDVQPEPLERLAGYGLARGWNASGGDPRALRDELRAFARGLGIEEWRWKIFECSGTAAGQELAWSLLGPGAYLGVIGFTREKVALRLSNLMAFDAKAAGTWGCLPELYPEALGLVLDGCVAVAPFVELHPLDEIDDVLESARAHRLSRRPVLVPGDHP